MHSAKAYLLPKIQEIFLKLEDFQYMMFLDLNMGNYQFEMSDISDEKIFLPFNWEKYELCLLIYILKGFRFTPQFFSFSGTKIHKTDFWNN